jgi:hypothetical protein
MTPSTSKKSTFIFVHPVARTAVAALGGCDAGVSLSAE